MPQSFGCIYLHVIFSTKNRQSLLTDQHHTELARFFTPILQRLKAKLIAEGGMPDHVHMLIDLGREASAAEVLREIKSHSSQWLYGKTNRAFSWQAGYGVSSVSPSHIANVVRYIQNQQEHHRQKSFKEEFEEILQSAGVEFDPKYLWVEEG